MDFYAYYRGMNIETSNQPNLKAAKAYFKRRFNKPVLVMPASASASELLAALEASKKLGAPLGR